MLYWFIYSQFIIPEMGLCYANLETNSYVD